MISKNILILNKKEGETPLECLGRFRAKNKKYKDVKMTYAGRLDPMASGLMLVLAGEEVQKKQEYLKLNKEYEFKILFGFATDTYDILGKIQSSKIPTNITHQEIKKHLKFFTGKFKQTYPLYSSKNIKKIRAGHKVKFTEQEINVNSLKLIQIKSISSKLLLINIEKRINKIKGEFRQDAILKIWRKKLSKNSHRYFIASFVIKCGGGTYVRGIADSLGERINVPALAFSIKRTKIGKWAKAE